MKDRDAKDSGIENARKARGKALKQGLDERGAMIGMWGKAGKRRDWAMAAQRNRGCTEQGTGSKAETSLSTGQCGKSQCLEMGQTKVKEKEIIL